MIPQGIYCRNKQVSSHSAVNSVLDSFAQGTVGTLRVGIQICKMIRVLLLEDWKMSCFLRDEWKLVMSGRGERASEEP